MVLEAAAVHVACGPHYTAIGAHSTSACFSVSNFSVWGGGGVEGQHGSGAVADAKADLGFVRAVTADGRLLTVGHAGAATVSGAAITA